METKAFVLSSGSIKGAFQAGAFLLLNLVVNGQEKSLIIDAGNDTCVCGYSETQLGGNPTAQGGVSPYTYYWSGVYAYIPGFIYQYASDILNDTSLANPTIIGANTALDSYVLKLHVVDAIGTQAWDSVLVCSPHFTCLLWTPEEWILKGDSVMLFSVCFGGYEPQTYLWEPPNGLTDPTDVNTYASPDSYTLYFLTQWDSCNCVRDWGSAFMVNVIPVSLEKPDASNNLRIIPNPSSGTIRVQSTNSKEKIEVKIYSLIGKEILCISTFANKSINIEKLPPGIYVVSLYSDTRNLTIDKLIIE